MKFEDNWINAQLKVKVKNWDWDTMVAAHVLDNRAQISGLKFQAFIKLGQESYDDYIKPYLIPKESGGYALNRVREVDLSDLLLYCGLDSLLEWHLAKIQKREMRILCR